jgi:cysteine-rich protein H
MKKALFAALAGVLCSLNLAGADEDIAKFEAGCNAGIAQDCTRAGAYYSDKSSRSKNTDKQAREISVKFLDKACELKDGNGCLILAATYEAIFGDNKKAKFYIEKSCDLDYGSGCEMLGLRYENGTYGFEVDKKKAKYFYKKACKLGAKWSCKYEQAL